MADVGDFQIRPRYCHKQCHGEVWRCYVKNCSLYRASNSLGCRVGFWPEFSHSVVDVADFQTRPSYWSLQCYCEVWGWSVKTVVSSAYNSFGGHADFGPEFGHVMTNMADLQTRPSYCHKQCHGEVWRWYVKNCLVRLQESLLPCRVLAKIRSLRGRFLNSSTILTQTMSLWSLKMICDKL